MVQIEILAQRPDALRRSRWIFFPAMAFEFPSKAVGFRTGLLGFVRGTIGTAQVHSIKEKDRKARMRRAKARHACLHRAGPKPPGHEDTSQTVGKN